MAKTQTVLQLFLASPSDVVEERKILEEVISELNITLGDTHCIRLELLKWETHTQPGFGEDAQAVINHQIGDNYDIFMGVMWGRFGSATNRAESGTEEEFERAYERLKKPPVSEQIMFYFKNAGIPPSNIDTDQLGKVQEFKAKISNEYGGLYHEFDTLEQFQMKARIHLSKLVQDWIASSSKPVVKKATDPTKPTYEEEFNPLSNLMALADEEDGLFELYEITTDAMEAVVDVVDKLSEATTDVGKKFRLRTAEVNKLNESRATDDHKAIKRISNNAANDLEVYVQRMSVEIPEFHMQHSSAMEAFGKIALISSVDLDEDPDDIRTILSQIQGYRAGLSNSTESLANFRKTTEALPRMTTAFNRARKRAVAVLDDMLIQLRRAESQAGDVEELLKRMLDSESDIDQ